MNYGNLVRKVSNLQHAKSSLSRLFTGPISMAMPRTASVSARCAIVLVMCSGHGVRMTDELWELSPENDHRAAR
jgi:hypothetical protein